jgi:hypothetical protein
VLSIFGGKKSKKAAQRAAQYQANEQEILAGRAVMATDVMTESDMAFLRKVWPSIRVAASFDHPNWASLGYPSGPPLTPAAKAAITHAWPTVHVAANFDDVNWQYHAVPNEIVAKLLPLPELGYKQPTVDLPVMESPLSYMPGDGSLPGGYAPVTPIQAGMFPGVPKEVLIAGAIGLGVLLLLSNRR